MHRAAAVRAVVGEEARLETDEGDGVGRPHRCAEHTAGIGLEAARDVHRQHGRGLRVHEPYRFEVRAADLTLQTDAEETVDHEVPPPASRHVRLRGAAGIAPRAECAGGVGGELRRVAHEHHRHVEPPGLQVTRDDERIAAVVAGSGEHEHRHTGTWDQLARELGGGEPGALHERGRVGQSRRSLLDLANLAGEMDGREILVRFRGHDARAFERLV